MSEFLRGEGGWLVICVVFWAVVFWVQMVNDKGEKK